MQQLLAFREGHQLRSFYRKNLSYVVRQTATTAGGPTHTFQSAGQCTGIPTNRKKTKEWAEFLNEQGLSADYFHAGLPPEVKARKQEACENNQARHYGMHQRLWHGHNKPGCAPSTAPTHPIARERTTKRRAELGDNLRAFAVLLYKPGTDERATRPTTTNKYPEKEVVRRIYDAPRQLPTNRRIPRGGHTARVRYFPLLCQLPLCGTPSAIGSNLLSMCGYRGVP